MTTINATHEDQIRISYDFTNGKSVTLSGEEWLYLHHVFTEMERHKHLFQRPLTVGLCTWCGGPCRGGHPYD